MINIIAAVAQKSVIGKDGKLPWKLKADMARFKELTMGNIVIFGLNTFNEFKRPLEGRENIVLSTHNLHIDGVEVFDSLDKAIAYAKTQDKEIFICGGEKVYKEALEIADRLYITHIHANFDGDRYFPDVPKNFKCVASEDIIDNDVPTTFCIYQIK
ncbi:MAG: dihydrofolate reductase [Clostridia bacterium]|nr:dihydrofolate reductase [Clostridia bacterium]